MAATTRLSRRQNERRIHAGRGVARLVVAAACAFAALPAPADGQIARLLQAVRDGGGWARFNVEGGRAGYRSAAVPVAGLSLAGCFQVVQPRMGVWTITARDMLGDGKIEATVEAGEPFRFSYEAGFRTQLDVVAEWSEPRDTTLVLWIGLETLADEERDVCQPPPGGGREPRGHVPDLSAGARGLDPATSCWINAVLPRNAAGSPAGPCTSSRRTGPGPPSPPRRRAHSQRPGPKRLP